MGDLFNAVISLPGLTLKHSDQKAKKKLDATLALSELLTIGGETHFGVNVKEDSNLACDCDIDTSV